MFEIGAKSKVTVRIYGQELQLTKPTVGQYESLQQKLSEATTDLSKFKLTKAFVVDLGIPESVANNMEVEHFTALIEYLSGSKKN